MSSMFERCCCQSANIYLVTWKCCQEEREIRNRGQQQEIYEQRKSKVEENFDKISTRNKKRESVKQKLEEGGADHINEYVE